MKNTYLFIKRDAGEIRIRATHANGLQQARKQAKVNFSWELVSYSPDVASYRSVQPVAPVSP